MPHITQHPHGEQKPLGYGIYAMAAAEVEYAIHGPGVTQAMVESTAATMDRAMFTLGLEAALGVITPWQLFEAVYAETVFGPSGPDMATPMPLPSAEQCAWAAELVGVPGAFSALLGFGG